MRHLEFSRSERLDVEDQVLSAAGGGFLDPVGSNASIDGGRMFVKASADDDSGAAAARPTCSSTCASRAT